MSSHGDSEKAGDIDVRAANSSSSASDSPTGLNRIPSVEVDAAWQFLNDHRDAAGVANIDITALRHKIDLRIVPLMFCCYTMQFLDKVILNVSLPCLVALQLSVAPHKRDQNTTPYIWTR